MPLNTPQKLAKITANLAKIRQGRTQPVILTFKHADGTTSTQTVNVILRAQQDADPDLDPQGHGQDFKVEDYVMSILTSDVSYAQFRSCIYVDVPASDGGTIIATRFIPTAIDPKGMLPGANRLVVALLRQRM